MCARLVIVIGAQPRVEQFHLVHLFYNWRNISTRRLTVQCMLLYVFISRDNLTELNVWNTDTDSLFDFRSAINHLQILIGLTGRLIFIIITTKNKLTKLPLAPAKLPYQC